MFQNLGLRQVVSLPWGRFARAGWFAENIRETLVYAPYSLEERRDTMGKFDDELPGKPVGQD
jgi:hypothetical protein